MRTVLILVLLLTVSDASAARRPIPPSEFTPQAQTWLARGMVGEAGWYAKRDHVGIAYVLARRWRRMLRRWPEMRFVTVIRNYCAALGTGRRSFTPRQIWIRALVGPEQPLGWPRRASWDRHRPLWKGALDRAELWSQGRLRDPCRGKAWNWGGDLVPDITRARQNKLRRVDCGDTGNFFYDDGNGDDDDDEIASTEVR